MRKYASVRNVAPLCGVVLGLLVLCNTGFTTVSEASDVAGGWHLIAIGSHCLTSTTLSCPGGEDASIRGCTGPNFPGVVGGMGGIVTSLGYLSGCHSTSNPDSWYCNNVWATYCKY
jgi:hypothetical protein